MVTVIVVLALASALLYGVGDYFGGVAARRIPVLTASTINYALATVVLVVALLVAGGAWSQAAVAGGIIAGVLAAVGFLTFYAALAAGPISLMSPLMALLSSAVPVVVAFSIGDDLGVLAWIAIALAIVGSVLISVERRVDARSARPRTLLFAVIAGLCLGFATVALDAVPDDAGMVPVFLDTTIGFVLLLGLVALTRAVPSVRRLVSVLDAHEPAPISSSPATAAHLSTTPAPGPALLTVDDTTLRNRARILAAVAGLLIGGANVLLMVALHAGSVAVVAVLVNLYPVATVLLAWVLLRERVNAVQATGIVLAVTASVMLGMA